MFTDQDAEKEDPQLFWRRDAILTIDMEKKVFVFKFVEQNTELLHILYQFYYLTAINFVNDIAIFQ